MDDLPPPIILEILSRLGDSADLARCRVASRSFNSLSRDVRSITLQCSYQRYLRSRSPLTRSSVTPFKTIFRNLVFQSRIIENVSIGVEKTLRSASYDDLGDEDDDLHLTEENFVRGWLPRVCDTLRLLSVSDFWVQSCWRRSNVLELISLHCHNLCELEIKNAWLSVDGLCPMPNLTHLTLEYVRLDDENLEKVNEFFPSLQVLNLIGVGGLKDPSINLLHLNSCRWTVSNAPFSVAIIAPKLVKLKLTCIKPKSLVIDAPSLCDLHLSVQEARSFKVQEACNLENLHLESANICHLIHVIPFGKMVKKLVVDPARSTESIQKAEKLSIASLFHVFPNVNSLTLCSVTGSILEIQPCPGGLDEGMLNLKELTVYFEEQDSETALSVIFFLLNSCSNLSDVAVLTHRDIILDCSIISRCMACSSRVRWRWGTWKKGTKDAWISDSI